MAVVKLSGFLSIGSDVIALSAVAFGTSLPELAVSIASVKKGKPEMAVGNIIGSNIFNTGYVMNYGGPTTGAIYYLSLSFDQLLN